MLDTIALLLLIALITSMGIRWHVNRYQDQERRTQAARRRLGFDLDQYMKDRRERIRSNR